MTQNQHKMPKTQIIKWINVVERINYFIIFIIELKMTQEIKV